MTYPDELDLDRTPHEPPPPHRPLWLWAALALVVVAAIAIYVFWGRGPEPSEPVAEMPAPAAPAAPSGPLGGDAEAIELPPLGETDPVVRDLVGELSADGLVARWLAGDGLVRNFTAVALNVADGRYPGRLLARFRASEPFRVVERDGRLVIDPRSYARYDGIADAVTSIDPARASQVYATLKPRIEEAYRELGYPEGSVDAAIERALVRLINTPVPAGDIQVVPKGALYAYANPSFESLSNAQKLLLRTGPDNARRIQAHLREIARALGIPAERLG